MRAFKILIIILSVITSSNMYAVKAYPYPIKISQADGTELTIRLHGDEKFHYNSTTDGHLIAQHNGIYHYAKIDTNGRIINTNQRASEVGRRTLAEKKIISELSPINSRRIKSRISSLSRVASTSSRASIQKSYPLSGSPKSLVILVNFADVSFVTPNPKTAFTNLLNQPKYSTNGGTGSARDYFSDNSMNVFNPQFDVVGPYKLPNNMAFYGENDDSSDDDKNPRQMVIDACKLAADNGIDFTQYDTDNDGYVDNIFIYYAGYNEAERGPTNSIWPHRWQLATTSTKFNGKTIYDYACTSELRGSAGTNMCGIGTFVHEFGHVLGLPDMYNTSSADSHTLDNWDVMDNGPYLNYGRTPPAYSSYERFYLNWLKPTELKVSGNYKLESLVNSNKAYLISQYGVHNLEGQNPKPVEFFLFENRQKIGWDKYLPGHGMIITHINYNASDWDQNQPNNNESAMGVDLIEADEIASSSTLSNDPFPQLNATSFTPTLRSGIKLDSKLVSLITENQGIIDFHFSTEPVPQTSPTVATEATDITTGSFIANWEDREDTNGSYFTAYTITEGTSKQTEGFDNGLTPPVGWAINASKTGKTVSYVGKATPSIEFSNNNDSIETEEYILAVQKLSFYIRSLDATNGTVLVQGKDTSTNTWTEIDKVQISAKLNETKTIDLSDKNYTKFKLTYQQIAGSIYIDDITATFDKNLEFITHEKWTTASSETLMSLNPNQTYYYKVRATRRIVNSEQLIIYDNYSKFSNIIEVTTLENKIGNVFRVINSETIEVLVPTTNLTVRIYNLLGQQVKTIIPSTNIFNIEGLPKGQVYIIQAGEQRAKILL